LRRRGDQSRNSSGRLKIASKGYPDPLWEPASDPSILDRLLAVGVARPRFYTCMGGQMGPPRGWGFAGPIGTPAAVGLSDTHPSGNAGNRRPGRMQRNRLVTDIDTGLGIGSQGGFKGLGEARFELADSFEARTELRVERRPGNSR